MTVERWCHEFCQKLCRHLSVVTTLPQRNTMHRYRKQPKTIEACVPVPTPMTCYSVSTLNLPFEPLYPFIPRSPFWPFSPGGPIVPLSPCDKDGKCFLSPCIKSLFFIHYKLSEKYKDTLQDWKLNQIIARATFVNFKKPFVLEFPYVLWDQWQLHLSLLSLLEDPILRNIWYLKLQYYVGYLNYVGESNKGNCPTVASYYILKIRKILTCKIICSCTELQKINTKICPQHNIWNFECK